MEKETLTIAQIEKCAEICTTIGMNAMATFHMCNAYSWLLQADNRENHDLTVGKIVILRDLMDAGEFNYDDGAFGFVLAEGMRKLCSDSGMTPIEFYGRLLELQPLENRNYTKLIGILLYNLLNNSLDNLQMPE